MAKRPAQKTEAQLLEEAKAFADAAVNTANANRAKVGHRSLTPRESIAVYQAALSEYRRRQAQQAEGKS